MDSPYRTASELVVSIKTLLTLPDVYLRVKAVVEDPNSILTDLVNAISVDPGITARLLRIVNSAFYNLGAPVDNVRQAVNLLGMGPVHDLVLATTLTGAFAKTGGDARKMRDLWVLSVRHAVYSRLLADRCGVDEPEPLFIEGLLSHIGHQVMYLQLPEEADAAHQAAASAGTALAQVETDMLGFSYADVGSELMRGWGLPERLVRATRDHVDPDPDTEFAMDAAIVHIADALARHHGREVDRDRLQREINPAAWRITGLTPDDVAPLQGLAAEQLDEATGMLLSGGAAT